MPMYCFNVMNRDKPPRPHLLLINVNQRSGKIDWNYFEIIGKFVPSNSKAKASGNVAFVNGGREFDLNTNGGKFGTLTLQKALKAIAPNDTGIFVPFSGSVQDVTLNKIQ
jgi:hypothetical protein